MIKTYWQAIIGRTSMDDDTAYWAADQLDAMRMQILTQVDEDNIVITWRDDDAVDVWEAHSALYSALDDYGCKWLPKFTNDNTVLLERRERRGQ